MARLSRITAVPEGAEGVGDLPPVPSRVRSLDGQLMYTGVNVWRMHLQ